MGKLLVALFLFLSQAQAAEEGFITIQNQKVYTHWQKAEQGAPTIVLLHGLTYSTSSWDPFVRAFHKPGLGILRYDMVGMGKTLLEGPLPVNYAIPYKKQVTLLKQLLDRLHLKKVTLVGLSYGGGIGISFANKYPQMVENLILMAPFTAPLKTQDQWIKLQVASARLANPWNPATDDELYDFFLRQFIYSTYPNAEPVVLENPFKLEAVFRMVQGIRKFFAIDEIQNLPAKSVHLMVANQDQYIPRDVMDTFWDALPESVKASRVNISVTEHKIPEAIPLFSSAWVEEVLKNPALKKGLVFDGSVWNRTATSGKTVIDLNR